MPETIPQHLQREEVRERIQRNFVEILAEVAVTTGQAAEFLYFTESQLRNLEKEELVIPMRTPEGRRQYTLEELVTIAIIRELLDYGYFTVGDIRSQNARIKGYLQREEVRERIPRTIEGILAKVAVTTGQAAKLSRFSANQLRDWERPGLLQPERPDRYDHIGQRNYPLKELYKLAVIRELLDASYSIGKILDARYSIEDIISSENNATFLSFFLNLIMVD